MNSIDSATLRWLVGGLFTAIVSLLLATWRTARRSKEAEDALSDVARIKLVLFGDQVAGRQSLIQDVAIAKESASYGARVARILFRAFRVPSGSNEQEAVQYIRDAVNESNLVNTGVHPIVQVPAAQREGHAALRPRATGPFKPPLKREEE
jgi:hypothetical protein